MSKGIRLFRVLGITISIDYTWFIVFFLISWSLSYGYYPAQIPGLTPVNYISMGLLSSLLLFACVLIHELSHSYTSNRLGIEVKEITLFIFGGIAHLSKEPDDPIKELKIAIAGPAASAALALAFFLLRAVSVSYLQIPPLTVLLSFLMTINLILLIFNLIPGLPLDGGRVLKAIWWWKTGNLERATHAASEVGRAFALFLIFMGFLQMAVGNFIGGLWSILIGVFLRQAASGSYKQLMLQKRLETVKVEEIMTVDVQCVKPDIYLDTIVEELFFTHHFVSFPVTTDGTKNSALQGLLTLNDIRAVGKDRWSETLVRNAMEETTEENILTPDSTALLALQRMTNEGRGRFVVASHSRVIGIVTRRDIMKILQFKMEFDRK